MKDVILLFSLMLIMFLLPLGHALFTLYINKIEFRYEENSFY